MGTRFVIIGMTTGAIRLVAWRLPNHRLAVALVTTGTHQTKSMVSRISGRGMPEVDSRPVVGVVTFIALHVSNKVIDRFTCRGGAIVTIGTATRHQSVIKIYRAPRQIIMATIALP